MPVATKLTLLKFLRRLSANSLLPLELPPKTSADTLVFRSVPPFWKPYEKPHEASLYYAASTWCVPLICTRRRTTFVPDLIVHCATCVTTRTLHRPPQELCTLETLRRRPWFWPRRRHRPPQELCTLDTVGQAVQYVTLLSAPEGKFGRESRLTFERECYRIVRRISTNRIRAQATRVFVGHTSPGARRCRATGSWRARNRPEARRDGSGCPASGITIPPRRVPYRCCNRRRHERVGSCFSR
jgi:hypothetical protein